MGLKGQRQGKRAVDWEQRRALGPSPSLVMSCLKDGCCSDGLFRFGKVGSRVGASKKPVVVQPRSVSLWLMSSGSELEKQQAILDRTAASIGVPGFTPHVTLLGGMRFQSDERLKEILFASHKLSQ